MKNLDTHFFAAIPFKLIDAAGDGDITPSMLAVMIFLYRWASWKKGMVKRTSAGAIAQFCQGKWSERTIGDAMKRLEDLGYITRHFKPGSRKWYPVTIHNYIAKVKHAVMGPDGKRQEDAVGRVVTAVRMEPINLKKIKGWDEDEDESLRRDCADCSEESSGDCSDDSSDEASEDYSDEPSDNTNNKRPNHERESSGKKGSKPATTTTTGRSGLQSQASTSSSQELKDWAERIARKLEPESKYLGASVQKLLDFLPHADESARTCISDAVSDPFVLLKLNQATDSKMGYLIDSVRKGYVQQWLEKAEKARNKRRKHSPPDAAAPPTPPDPSGAEEPYFEVGMHVTSREDGKEYIVTEAVNGKLLAVKPVEDMPCECIDGWRGDGTKCQLHPPVETIDELD